MSLLFGIGAVSSEKARPTGDTTYGIDEALELGQASGNYEAATTAISEAWARVDELLERAVVSDNVDPANKALVQRDRAELCNNLHILGYTEETAGEMTLGFESATSQADLGNESWQTVKKAVNSAIDWIMRKMEDAKEYIMKVFHRFFGAFENAKGNFQKMVDKAEESSRDGLVLDSKAENEFTRNTEYFSAGGSIGDAAKFATFANNLTKTMRKANAELDIELAVPAPKDLLADGEESLQDVKALRKALPMPKGDGKTTILKDRQGYTHKGATKYGERSVFTNTANIDDTSSIESMLAELKSCRYSILTDDAKFKAKDKVKVSLAEAAAVADLANAMIALLDEAIETVRGSKMAKLEKAYGKAAKDIKGWKKEAPEEKSTSAAKAAYRQALGLVTSWLSAKETITVGRAKAVADYVLKFSTAMGDYGSRSLKAHKKPD